MALHKRRYELKYKTTYCFCSTGLEKWKRWSRIRPNEKIQHRIALMAERQIKRR
jgi:hypothetical protein